MVDSAVPSAVRLDRILRADVIVCQGSFFVKESKMVRVFGYLLVATLVGTSVKTRSIAENRVSYTIVRTNSEIKIDGRIEEAAWKNATDVGDFKFPWWKEGRKEQTVAKLLWNDEYLYVSFRCEDAHVWAEHTQHDSPVSRDDCVELFTAPNPSQPVNYFNIEMNLLSACLDRHHPNGPEKPEVPNWNARGVKIATTVNGTLNDDVDTDRSWTLEAAIPFANFESVAKHTPPHDGDVWHMNLNRLGGRTNPQHSQWSPGKSARPSFHKPEYFGRVIFSK